MGVIQFNVGKAYTVTAPASSATDLSVTIGDKEFAADFDTNAATTAAAFVAAHGKELNTKLGIYAVVSGNNVVFNGVPEGRKFTTSNTVTVADNTKSYGADDVSFAITATANIATVTCYTSGATTATATVTYFDGASALADQERVNHLISKDLSKVGAVKVARASSASIA
jgi:hypothetical protein